jgi:hypothetical protein
MKRFLVSALALLLSAQTQVVVQTPRTIATSQVTVASTAGGTLVAAARTSRISITIQNHSEVNVYCGPVSPTRTTSNGFRLPGVDGASITIETTAAVQCIAASGSVNTSVVETIR